MTSNPCVPDLYALYASKNRLCMLCRNTTPKKTAYNAYRNENRRVRRAEGTKMYAVGDAYRLHTKCIQAYKKRKREEFLSLLLYIVRSYIFYCPRFTGDHLLLFVPSDMYGCPIRPSGLIARSSRSGSAVIHDKPLGSRLVCIVCIKKPTMHAMREHNSEIDCIQCIQEDGLAQE